MMRIMSTLIGSILILCGTSTAMAGIMKCGTHYIDDGQADGQTQDVIRAKCGEPSEEKWNDWVYKIDDKTYRLHFNDNKELETIYEE